MSQSERNVTPQNQVVAARSDCRRVDNICGQRRPFRQQHTHGLGHRRERTFPKREDVPDSKIDSEVVHSISGEWVELPARIGLNREESVERQGGPAAQKLLTLLRGTAFTVFASVSLSIFVTNRS